MDLGKQIKALRQSRGLTQEQLAEKMDVSVQTISRWEKSVNYPDITMLPILASSFNVATDYLLCVNENERKKIPHAAAAWGIYLCHYFVACCHA